MFFLNITNKKPVTTLKEFFLWFSVLLFIFLSKSQTAYSLTLIENEKCLLTSLNKIDQNQLEKLVIGHIEIIRRPIFDESNNKESSSFYLWVNKIHYMTKEKVIRKDLLFRIGETLEIAKVKETERLLRRRNYLWDANITIIRKCNRSVDLRVITRCLDAKPLD